ncbi:MAG: WD40/YVTN/BNR-like repeat-containing protein, partial [Phycisphaerales bacterium]
MASSVLAQENLGPAPIVNSGGLTGRVSAVVADPVDENRYFLTGADGGVWRTLDGGASWTPLTDTMPTQAMGALAMDPTNSDVLYAGTGEANYANHSRYGLGLYKTDDGGETWLHLAEDVFAGRCFSKIAINHENPQVLFASITRAGGFPELAAAKGHP